MKRTILPSTSAVLTATALLLGPACGTAGAADRHGESTVNAGFQKIINPEIPSYINFANQKISTDRIDMYEKLDRELTAMSYTHGNTLLTIKRANRYFPIMAPILAKAGIPADMLYLAAIESNLDIRALSPAKAAGIWQFMPSTAKQYGLEVNDEVDERYNIEKETEAACRYLKNAYLKYGNWESVAASYNAGTARISSEMESQLADSAFDLFLVNETTRYPFRIIAAKLIMENPKAYGFHLTPEQLYQPVKCSEVTVDGPVDDWPAWAKSQGITYAQLREFNPWIRAKKLTNKAGKTYTVKIPKEKSLYRSSQEIKIYNPAWVD